MKTWFIPLIALGLGLMGLVTLASVSPELMRRQLVFFFVSACVFWAASRFPLTYWWQWGKFLWKALCVVLLGLLLFGRVTRGAAAWIDIGWGMRFQPSQFALLITLFATLPVFAKQRMLSERQLVELLWWLGAPAVLILLQPDFGTVFLYAAAASIILFWQKIPKKYWQVFAGGLVTATLIGWLFVLQPYQKLRITSFFSGTQADQTGAGYNARQALIAVGSGEIWGRGLGHGSQSQLRFLPERQTDFIFASLAEEWGLVGSLSVIGLYTALIAFLFQQAQRANNARHALFLTVTAVAFFVQVFVNIGMNIGLMPITGVTLPLVSYGGSSVLATMLLLGVAQQLVLQTSGQKHLRIS